jgi:hypothetical protein
VLSSATGGSSTNFGTRYFWPALSKLTTDSTLLTYALSAIMTAPSVGVYSAVSTAVSSPTKSSTKKPNPGNSGNSGKDGKDGKSNSKSNGSNTRAYGAGFMFLALLAVVPARIYFTDAKKDEEQTKKNASKDTAYGYDLDGDDKGEVATEGSLGFVETGNDCDDDELHRITATTATTVIPFDGTSSAAVSVGSA